ncbi:MAG: LCP family protein [Erysipelotrichaceae bacterium]|nr:LCP family protein [Erysipelotrichaceae bacterium]
MNKKKKIVKYKVASLIALTVFLITLFANYILPLRYELVISIVSIMLFLFAIRIRSKTVHIVFIVMMLVPTFGLFYSQSVFNRIFENSDFETNKISFIKLTKSDLTVDSINTDTVFGQSIGFDNDSFDQINEDLNSRFDFNVNMLTSESDFDTVQKLYDREFEIGIIDNAVIETIAETYPWFGVDFEVLWTIEREIKRDDITKEVSVDKDAFVVLISGIDITGPISLRSRSDVNILMVVNPNKGSITLVSIPRDMFVPFSCQNDALDKLTHTGIYGINCTVQTIENFVDIDINYYVRMNFTSFIKIIDVIGNIDVYSNYNFTTTGGLHTFKKGMNILNSEQALAFARERKVFEEGDVQRGLNQQEVIKSVIKKLISPNTLTKIDKIVSSVAKSIDTNLDPADLQKLIALQIDKGIDWKFSSYHISGTESRRETYSIPGQELFVVLPSSESVENIKEVILDATR